MNKDNNYNFLYIIIIVLMISQIIYIIMTIRGNDALEKAYAVNNLCISLLDTEQWYYSQFDYRRYMTDENRFIVNGTEVLNGTTYCKQILNGTMQGDMCYYKK